MIRLKRASECPEPNQNVLAGVPPGQDTLLREKYIALMEALFPVLDKPDLFTRIVMISNNLFGAERGALFWYKKDRSTLSPEIKAGVNLDEADVADPGFKPGITLVGKAFQSGQVQIRRHDKAKGPSRSDLSKWAALCIPLKIAGRIQAVLYHDQFFSANALDFFSRNPSRANVLVRHLTSYVEYGIRFGNTRVPETIPRDTPAGTVSRHQDMIYDSKAMATLIHESDKAAGSDTSVLILGETGVGKELLARRIHSNSLRRENPFVTINATTIPEGLFESELFGHEKGAFTGAERQKKGLIEVADEGTLFIDEVGELPLHMQVKLLRAIQERTFYRVGGTKPVFSNFRLITATNSDLMLEACEGRFREDLYYRLNLFTFTIPPLREREQDVLLIADHYLDHYTVKYCKKGLHLDTQGRKALLEYPWPGNVRELKNIIEKAVIMTPPNEAIKIHIPTAASGNTLRNPFADTPTLNEINRRYIQYVLNKTNGKIGGPGGAAEVMNIGRTTLTARMKRLGLK